MSTHYIILKHRLFKNYTLRGPIKNECVAEPITLWLDRHRGRRTIKGTTKGFRKVTSVEVTIEGDGHWWRIKDVYTSSCVEKSVNLVWFDEPLTSGRSQYTRQGEGTIHNNCLGSSRHYVTKGGMDLPVIPLPLYDSGTIDADFTCRTILSTGDNRHADLYIVSGPTAQYPWGSSSSHGSLTK